MLVLSRKIDESIMIGDAVRITVVDVHGDKVRLGIMAPKEIPVHRREVYDAMQREQAKFGEIKLEKTPISLFQGPLPKRKPPGLVLSRAKDESIMIGDDVEVSIVDVRGDKVRLGIVCPREPAVHREEVYDAIQRDKGSVVKERAQTWTKEQQEVPIETSGANYLLCEIRISDNATEEDIESIVLRFAEDADELHRAMGGSGLTIETLEMFGDVPVMEVVKT